MAGSLLGLLDNDDDRSQAADHAAHRAGGSGNSDLFKSVLGSLVSSKERVSKEDIDEDGALARSGAATGPCSRCGKQSRGTAGS